MSTHHCDTQPEAISAVLVPEDERLDILPRYFGRHMLACENAVYAWLTRLTPDYEGGYWHFYTLSNGGFYMAPALDQDRGHIAVVGNHFDASVATDTAGVIATLFALNTMVCKTHDEHLLTMYERLLDFAGDHPEGAAIYRAID